MSFKLKNWSLSKVVVPGATASCLAIALLLGIGDGAVKAEGQEKIVASAAPAAVFSANAATLGAIPDSTGPATCGVNGLAKDVTFTASGLSGAPTNVSVDMTINHSWRADITATLVAPNGATHILFGRTGATTAAGCGNGNDLLGNYTYNDAAALTTWWTIAGNPTPAGAYRTTSLGGVAAGGAVTLMNPAFAGVANPNGTWTLRLTDAGIGDTGSITAASLTIDAGTSTPSNAMHDYDGDGRSDHVVVRNVGGGQDGQVRWFVNPNNGGTQLSYDWGIASDFFIGGDFDGDDKDDIAVWRGGSAGTFFILNSETSTARVELFGQNGDDPTVVGDYDGDGKADVAVYRAGATGQPSTWFYRGSDNNPSGNVTFVPWGIGGDFPAPGDYDGDGKNDFVVQRGGASTVFWRLFAGGSSDSITFGNASDVVVPGDYDGDGKTDIAVAHLVSGNFQWWYYSSLNNVGLYAATFGLSSDFLLAGGDYDGDGRADFGIWRDGVFWYQSSATGTLIISNWGSTGDYPVANYPVH